MSKDLQSSILGKSLGLKLKLLMEEKRKEKTKNKQRKNKREKLISLSRRFHHSCRDCVIA